MPGTRSHTQMLARREEVARRYLRGEHQYTIGRAVGVSQVQVSHDLKAMRDLWLASSLRDFDALKAEQLAKIDAVEVEAYAAWFRSQQPREVSLTEQTEGGEVVGVDGTSQPKRPTRKASMRREGQSGDPRFLAVIQKCIDQRCVILGLESPLRISIDQAAAKVADELGLTKDAVLAEATAILQELDHAQGT
mgnify:CR=1 FL=1